MKLSKIFNLSLNMLLHSKLRSWLTILGIFIGVSAVIVIISLGQGLQQNVNAQIEGLGQDIITISAGSSRAIRPGPPSEPTPTTNINELSEKDLQALKLVPGIKHITGTLGGVGEINYQSETTTSSILGINPKLFEEFITSELEFGRYLSSGDVNSVVIGNNIANKIFKRDLEIGYLLTIEDKVFRVSGILSPSSGISSSDNTIYMSLKNAREILDSKLNLKDNEYSSIVIKVNDADFVKDITEDIEETLRNSHHVAKGKEDFTVISFAAIQEQFATITAGITLFLGVIAAVSLLVGGIGVANTMFTSVLEKTKDIGTMKAIGAKNSSILLIFLFNSGLLGLVGGLLGIFFAVFLSLTLPLLGLNFGPPGSTLKMPIDLGLLIFGVVFSVIIGMLSGVIPAYRASKLNPVDALRYE